MSQSDIINSRQIQWFPGHMTKTLRLMEKEIVADRRFHRGGRSVPPPVRQSPDSSFHLQCLNDLFPCLNAHLTHRLVN